MAKHPIRKFQRLTTGDDAFRAKFRSWDMTELSYVDIREYLKEKDTVLVPMASTEQHGPHLPLYTDTITAIEIAKEFLKQLVYFILHQFGQVIHHNTCICQVKVAAQSQSKLLH